jgi:hypothetical protein
MFVLGIAAFGMGFFIYQKNQSEIGLWCMIVGVTLGIIGLLASLSSRRN